MTDEFGNNVTIPVEPPEDGDDGVGPLAIAGATVATGGIASPTGTALAGSATLSGPAIGLLATGTAVSIGYAAQRHNEYDYTAELQHPDVGLEEGSFSWPGVPTSPNEKTWRGDRIADLPDDMTISLPTGEVDDDGQYHRGYGKKYIEETTSLTANTIGNAIENPEEVIERNDEVRYVIGDPLSDVEKAIVSVIGGAVAAAYEFNRPVEHEASESGCGAGDFTVETENEVSSAPKDNPEHAIRDEKLVNGLDEFDDIIRFPDHILEFNNKRMWLFKKMDNGKIGIVSIHKIGGTDSAYSLGTQMSGEAGYIFELLEAAIERIKDEQNGKVTTDVRC